MKISEKALEKIKESGIKPISKKVFNIKKVTFWTLVVLSIFIGSASFAIILSILVNNDWQLYHQFGLGFIFNTLPYFWLICLAIFAVLAEYYYRKTLFGYKHTIISIVGLYITITIASGGIFQLIGIGNRMEYYLFSNVSVYHNLRVNNSKFWDNPEEGLLSGRIIEIDDNIVRVVDRNNKIWLIDVPDDAISLIEIGQVIKIVGNRTELDSFKADYIRSFSPRIKDRSSLVKP